MNNYSGDILIRENKKENAEELYKLFEGLTEQAKYFFHPHAFDKETITEICTSKKDHYYVMLLNDKIIGYSFLRLFGFKIPSFGCCIHNEYQNKGYGTLLTRWTIDKAREIGYGKIILKVYKENKNAFHVYQKTGFKIVDELNETREFKMAIDL